MAKPTVQQIIAVTVEMPLGRHPQVIVDQIRRGIRQIIEQCASHTPPKAECPVCEVLKTAVVEAAYTPGKVGT